MCVLGVEGSEKKYAPPLRIISGTALMSSRPVAAGSLKSSGVLCRKEVWSIGPLPSDTCVSYVFLSS